MKVNDWYGLLVAAVIVGAVVYVIAYPPQPYDPERDKARDRAIQADVERHEQMVLRCFKEEVRGLRFLPNDDYILDMRRRCTEEVVQIEREGAKRRRNEESR